MHDYERVLLDKLSGCDTMRSVIGRSCRSRDRDLALSKAMAERLLLSCVLQLSLQIESRRLICEREIVLAMAVHVVQFQLRYSVLSLSVSLVLCVARDIAEPRAGSVLR